MAILIFSIIIFFLLYSSLVYYISLRITRFFSFKRLNTYVKIGYFIVIIFLATSLFTGRLLDLTFINKISSYWLAFLYIAILVIPLSHLILFIFSKTKFNMKKVNLTVGILVIISFISLFSIGSYNAYSPTTRSYSFEVEKGTSHLKELNIAVAADTHFGLLSTDHHAKRLVEQMDKIKPDLILLPGDLFDDDLDPFLANNIGPILAELDAPYGVYASLGNHDKENGQTKKMIAALKDANINILYDETIEIDNEFTIIGRKDKSDEPRKALKDLMKEVNPDQPVFLLEHQPYELNIAQKQGIDLMVSGHTHGGQIFPGNLMTKQIYENDSGYLKKGQLHSIVTTGFGFWGPPLRIGTQAEIIKLHITFN